jgi:uncharacterized repeat protein (TIGR03803 family)
MAITRRQEIGSVSESHLSPLRRSAGIFIAIFCVVILVVTALAVPAVAGTIDYPPSNNFNNVAANVPTSGNVWTGLAQSFTAEDSHILFGFYVGNFTGANVSGTLLFSLYAGDGQFTNLLGQASATATLGNFDTTLLQVDFSSVTLNPGDRYTVVVSLPSGQLPTLGTYSDLSVMYNSLNNSYPGGRFYFVGASYDESSSFLALRDLAFKVTPLGPSPTVLHSFSGTDGRLPLAGLITDAKGNLYGTTREGGTGTCYPDDGCGTVFELDTSGNLTVLHKFTSTGGDGAGPFYGNLAMDAAGNLYGTTIEGGDTALNNGLGLGVAFKIDTSGNETVLHTFTGPDGESPNGLVMDSAGTLYGTATFGGSIISGTVFKMDTSGNETLLHSFPSSPTDGQAPYAAPIIGPGGSLYGTTQAGGSYNSGTVFKVDTSGGESVLYSFNNSGGDGTHPRASLVMDAAGNLYGTTYDGGDFTCGTVFKLNTSGTETALHSFTNSSGDGGNPSAGLIIGPDGYLYGTTTTGGEHGYGTVFKMDTSLNETVLYSFTGGDDGAYPTSSLLMDAAGNLYGTASAGGTDGYGTVFELSTTTTSGQAVATMVNYVGTLSSQGTINKGQDKSLVKQLQHAIGMIDAGKTNGAIGNLESFISEVQDLQSAGVLTPSQAGALISGAKSVIKQLQTP